MARGSLAVCHRTQRTGVGYAGAGAAGPGCQYGAPAGSLARQSSHSGGPQSAKDRLPEHESSRRWPSAHALRGGASESREGGRGSRSFETVATARIRIGPVVAVPDVSPLSRTTQSPEDSIDT